MSELKPCPFCGKSDIHIEQKDTIFWCECYDCGASSRQYHTLPGVNILQPEDFARGYWNNRPLEDALHARIAELEAENQNISYFFHKLRMFCIFAHFDNPDTEFEFNKVDAEIREFLHEYKVCSDIERQEMSVSEHANYLLNEYGRLQFDYAFLCKPDGESLRNEARNNLEEYIAELEAAQRWIPVSERLPEDGEPVLAAYVDTMLTAAYYRHHIAFGGVDNWWDVEGCHTGNPTHWMPLPQPPEVK